MPLLSGADRVVTMPCRRSSLRVCALPMPCLSALCRRPAGRFAAMRHCDAVFAPPQHSESMRLLAHALRIGAMPRLGYAVPQHCRSIHGPSRRCAYRCSCGSGPYNASAIPSESVPAHCRAKLRHRTALLCHRVAPNAAQFLAIALQVEATQRLCQAWQSLLCRRRAKLSYTLALRRGLHIAFAPHTSHCRRPADALPLLGVLCSASPSLSPESPCSAVAQQPKPVGETLRPADRGPERERRR